MPRILLIDDTPEIAELLTYALRDHGYDVHATGFTDSITELVAEQQANAVVLDCSVFDMSEVNTCYETYARNLAQLRLT